MLSLLATFCAGLFAGAAGYVSLVGHPTRLELGPERALVEFRLSFPRARAIQAPLATVGAVAAGLAWVGGTGAAWLLVACLLAGIVLFSLLVVAPVYTELYNPELSPDSPEVSDRLIRWGRLHDVRSGLGVGAYLIALLSI